MKKPKIITSVALVAAALLVTSCGQPTQTMTEKSYKTLIVSTSSTEVSDLYTASIRGEQYVDIRPQISGVITKIAISEGATISKGQPLFIIDQVPYVAALDVATAAVKSAEAAVATARLNATSGKELLDESVISTIEYQTLQNTLLSAEATLAQAEANEKSAHNNLSYTVVKSPVNGVAGMINYRVGALVSSSIDSPLVSVANIDDMYAYFSLSESAFLTLAQQSGSSDALIEEMDDITLILSNGSRYEHKGEVDAISGVIDSSTGSIGIRAKFTNPDKMLRDGGNGTLSIKTKYDDVIVIPKVATYEIQNKIFVFKVIDNKAVSAEISVLTADNGTEYIVTGGIKVGDEIVAEGAGLLREGTVVKPTKEE